MKKILALAGALAVASCGGGHPAYAYHETIVTTWPVVQILTLYLLVGVLIEGAISYRAKDHLDKFVQMILILMWPIISVISITRMMRKSR